MLPENQYIATLNTRAMTSANVAPDRPPIRAPTATNSPARPAIRIQVFTRLTPIMGASLLVPEPFAAPAGWVLAVRLLPHQGSERREMRQ
jgi:hypothetical protein